MQQKNVQKMRENCRVLAVSTAWTEVTETVDPSQLALKY